MQGYTSGERVDFLVPLGKIERAPEERSNSEAYVLNLVYTFVDKNAAARELDRLVAMIKVGPGVVRTRGKAIIFEGNDSEIPGVTHRWFFMQRDRHLIVLSSPGMLQSQVFNDGPHGVQISPENLENINQAIEALFTKATAKLSR